MNYSNSSRMYEEKLHWFQRGCVFISLGFKERALSVYYQVLHHLGKSDHTKKEHDLKETKARIACAIASGLSSGLFTKIGIEIERMGFPR